MIAIESALTIAHVVDSYRCYPGESVTFYTRVQVRQPLPGYTLRIALPPELALESCQAPPGHDDVRPQIVRLRDGDQHVVWKMRGPLEAGASHEYQAHATIRPTLQDLKLKSRASAVPSADGENGEQHRVAETVCLAVSAKGRYLKYLPALYEDDEFMGRFLMLFESFWRPIEGTIDQLPYYLDPRTTPPDLLPWLASWLDLVLDERWTEDKRRRLLRSAVALYRRRGARQGLQEYLEIYTGAKPQMVEHRAQNFRLGPQARLGLSTALGMRNVPHTFTVVLRLPPVEADDAEEAARKEDERRRQIEDIIEAEKPAHTAYALQIETLREG